MRAPQTVADVLDAAADLIEPAGAWGQGGSGPRVVGNDGCHCADTAIYQSCAWTDGKDRAAVRQFFARQIGGVDQFDTYRWNDAPGRTQAEVVAKLREAAAVARSQEQGA